MTEEIINVLKEIYQNKYVSASIPFIFFGLVYLAGVNVGDIIGKVLYNTLN